MYSYDVFISHNRADKLWVRTLADRVASQQYNGRPLRPWLDEQFLDPGDLSATSELTTALDRSRFLALVLSPESIASKWVDFEVRHFLRTRGVEAVLPILRKTCSAPAALSGLTTFDLRDDGASLDEFVQALRPPAAGKPADVIAQVDSAFSRVAAADPGGFDALPTPERDAFFDALTHHSINDLASEGLALVAFHRAAEHLLRTSSYNFKMLLAETLAAALVRSPNYRQVVHRYLDTGAPDLLFVAARAYSKLAELDLFFVDLSVLLRVAAQLDIMASIGPDHRAIEMLLARTAGKLRETAAGELLIKALSEAGRSSRVIAAGAIGYSERSAAPVFYLSELQQAHAGRAAQAEGSIVPPHKRLLALLFSLDLDQDGSVSRAVESAREDLRRAFPAIDFPYGYSWLDVREGIAAAAPNNAPFMGTIAKATLRNMVETANSVGVSNVVCLTEPRIVDALFNGCGAMLILSQDTDSPQCRRLRSRGIPFAMLTPEAMAGLRDGEHIVVRPDRTSVRRASG